ncbi:hypothetical protein [Acetobacter sp.]|uniref:hypothetical protein n=1 Tax=Acetobacter sp. TaxID=440 RepID=UPI0039ECF0D6
MRNPYRKPLSVALALAVCLGGHLAESRQAKAQTVASGGESSGAYQPPPQPTEQQMAAMRKDVQTAASYALPSDFLPRMITTLQALQNAGLQPPAPSGQSSLEDTIRRVEAVPGIEPVLRAQGFTPRSFVMGLTCFGITYAITSNAQNAQNAPALNPNNVRLLQANPDATQALIQEMSNQPQQTQ